MKNGWLMLQNCGNPYYDTGFEIGYKIRLGFIELRSLVRNFFARMRQA